MKPVRSVQLILLDVKTLGVRSSRVHNKNTRRSNLRRVFVSSHTSSSHQSPISSRSPILKTFPFSLRPSTVFHHLGRPGVSGTSLKPELGLRVLWEPPKTRLFPGRHCPETVAPLLPHFPHSDLRRQVPSLLPPNPEDLHPCTTLHRSRHDIRFVSHLS